MSACPDCGEKLGARYEDLCWTCYLRAHGIEPNKPITAPRRTTNKEREQ
jgi:hypothetical protein